MNLSMLIVVALGVGALFGAGLNYGFPEAIAPLDHYFLNPLGQGFLRLIQFVVVPLVFSSLVLGLTRIQNAALMGRYLAKLMLAYGITSAISLGVGMTTALILQPGAGIEGLSVASSSSATTPSLIQWILSLIPTNPLAALTSGNLIQVIISAALFVIGIQQTKEKAAPFLAVIDSIYEISEKILAVILYVAPLGVFALMSSVIATQGLDLIARLFLYVAGLFIATALMIGFYLIILVLLKQKPLKLLACLTESLALAFGTASSNAVLPVLLNDVQEGYGLRPEIASFAIPLGTAIKRDGSAVLQGFNALFIAQIYHVPLTPSLLTAIALSSFLVSFSTPGVPGSALITMTTVLSAAGLPLEGVAIVAGIDRLTDGFKTVLNVIGNTTNAIILSLWENPEATTVAESLTPQDS